MHPKSDIGTVIMHNKITKTLAINLIILNAPYRVKHRHRVTTYTHSGALLRFTSNFGAIFFIPCDHFVAFRLRYEAV